MANKIKNLVKQFSPKYQEIFLEYKVAFKPRWNEETGHPELLEIIKRNHLVYKDHLLYCLNYKDVFLSLKNRKDEPDPTKPAWNNAFLPGLDIVALYGMIQKYRPPQYFEIGSGNSTQVARMAIKNASLNTKITSIDPVPRAEIRGLTDLMIQQPLEDIAIKPLIEELQAGDILFIDNSHRCFPNSDVTVCFLEILPRLKKGVIVHIHDIYLPWDYPQFMCDRFYSEQYLLATALLANPERYKVLLPAFFVSKDTELNKILYPLWEKLPGIETHGGSFWMEIGK